MMWKRLKRLFNRGDRTPKTEYDPIYGLSRRSVNDWFARNPKLRKKHEAELRSLANFLAGR
jgi:hypothetical protein